MRCKDETTERERETRERDRYSTSWSIEWGREGTGLYEGGYEALPRAGCAALCGLALSIYVDVMNNLTICRHTRRMSNKMATALLMPIWSNCCCKLQHRERDHKTRLRTYITANKYIYICSTYKHIFRAFRCIEIN